MARHIISLFFLSAFLPTSNLFSQTANNSLVKKWYHSPKESSGDTIVFRTTKYIPVPGIDNPAFEFSVVEFINPTDFSVKYWSWCRSAPLSNEGSWSKAGTDKIVLDFGPSKCKNQLKILEQKNDLLIVIIKE